MVSQLNAREQWDGKQRKIPTPQDAQDKQLPSPHPPSTLVQQQLQNNIYLEQKEELPCNSRLGKKDTSNTGLGRKSPSNTLPVPKRRGSSSGGRKQGRHEARMKTSKRRCGQRKHGEHPSRTCTRTMDDAALIGIKGNLLATLS